MDKYQQCRKCKGWVDITKKHCTGTVDGKTIYLHHDFCADYITEDVGRIRYSTGLRDIQAQTAA